MPKRKKAPRRSRSNRWWQSAWAYWGFRLLMAGGMLPLLFIGAVNFGFFGELPSKQDLKDIQNANASLVYSADGVLLGKYFLVNRSEVELEQIPPHLIDALIATEDARFYEHRGLDVRSIGRVLFKSLLFQQRSGGGGSTLTQQLSKNLYPRKAYRFLSTLINKIKEWIIAHRLEEAYSKGEILEMYLNTVPFGENVYGIEAASLRYFGKSSSKLAVQEGAVLVGMLKANHTYNPRLFPAASRGRRKVVLGQMAKYGYLEAEAADSLDELPLGLHYTRLSADDGIAPYFLDQIRVQTVNILNELRNPEGEKYNLLSDGLSVETTLNSRMQKIAEQSMKIHMKGLQDSFNRHWSSDEPWSGNPAILESAIKRSSRYRKMASEGYSHDQIIQRMNVARAVQIFDWLGRPEAPGSVIDSIKRSLKTLQAGFVVVDPSSGQIKVWIGGIDHEFFKYDHAKITTKRQVGSTFKPFVYATALQQGISPCDYIRARLETYEQYENWTPENADGDYEGRYSMAGAMSNSINTVTVKLIEEAGIVPTIEMVKSTGISSDIPQVPSIALGTPSISLTEMVQAYSVFVNRGQSCTPYGILRITNKDGEIIYQGESSCRSTQLSPENAQIMRRMLETVVDQGTAQRLRTLYHLKNDLAGKTGTTQNNADGWFMGMTPNLVAGAWVGADDPRIHFKSTSLGQGANTALPIFAKFIQGLNGERHFDPITQAKFDPLPAELEEQLDCDPFKEGLNFWQALFGQKDKEKKAQPKESAKSDSEEDEPGAVQKGKGFWNKVKGLFGKE